MEERLKGTTLSGGNKIQQGSAYRESIWLGKEDARRRAWGTLR